MSTSTKTAAIALDAATPGKKGKARAGFHLVFKTERFVSASGVVGRRNVVERCTCSAKGGNHAEIAR